MVSDVVSCVGRGVKECERLLGAGVQGLCVFVWPVVMSVCFCLSPLKVVVAEELKGPQPPDEDRKVPLKQSTATEMELSDIRDMIRVSPHSANVIWCEILASYDFEGWQAHECLQCAGLPHGGLSPPDVSFLKPYK